MISAVFSVVPGENKNNYLEYLATEVALYDERSGTPTNPFQQDLDGFSPSRILDLGCGAGQELLVFANHHCTLKVGADIQFEAGEVFKRIHPGTENDRTVFINSAGEELPFGGESFDLIICRVALPYMNSAKALNEISRVLAPEGRVLLTVHTPRFYFLMIRRRLSDLSIKSLAYPVICFAGGLWFLITGKQPTGNFWRGKETFHTRVMLERQLRETGLRILSDSAGEGNGGHTYLIGKN
ncbi:MAG: class I SAM-dependent methyltransferase [Acidobacteria bacterium]|nr:class I SAM-dependent methyltransferase [Acidobacteriota bacterium]